MKRLNAITAQLASLDMATAPVFVVNGLKREELIAANSMIIHELYFDGLGGEGGDESSDRSGEAQHQALAQDQCGDLAAGCAEGEAKTDFPRPPADGVSDQAVDAHGPNTTSE